jgi:hypothetical protein
VGLADPLTAADIAPDERLGDGFPQSLEEYVAQSGVRFFKVKVSNRLDWDLARLETVAAIAERKLGSNYHVTLDGNEQYKAAEQFDEFISRLRSNPRLATLFENILVIEQPLERNIALTPEHTQGIRQLGETVPVIIDESDGFRDAYPRAVELGYRGISCKSCKGVIRALLNVGLTWHLNGRGQHSTYVITGEDLCTVGIIPVQSDLCLAASLGLEHVERNGHHYHRGLSYLPEVEQQAAFAAHPDFYARQHGVIAPRMLDGQFRMGSFQCPGLGFAVTPDMDSMTPAEDWRFESLELES